MFTDVVHASSYTDRNAGNIYGLEFSDNDDVNDHRNKFKGSYLYQQIKMQDFMNILCSIKVK